MTDAEFECWSMAPDLKRLHGDVLIAGLGLGLIIREAVKQCRTVTVLEINPDIITLVGPHCKGAKIIKADVNLYRATKNTFDCIYFDIWPNVPNADDVALMNKLVKRYRPALRKGGWIGSWCERGASKR